MKKMPADESAPAMMWRVRETSLCRRMRVDDCLVLTVKAVYPLLIPADEGDENTLVATEEAMERFNRCYGRAAESFVDSGASRLGEEMEAAFRALSSAERHTFLRQELTVFMTARRDPADPDCLYVETYRSQGHRGGRNTVSVKIAEHLWKLPHGVMCCGKPSKPSKS